MNPEDTKEDCEERAMDGMKSSEVSMLDKLEEAAPYNIFFNSIYKHPYMSEQPNVIRFTDLLCPSLGELKSTLQLTFLINAKWLLKQYEARGLSSLPMTILHGKWNTSKKKEEEEDDDDDEKEEDDDDADDADDDDDNEDGDEEECVDEWPPNVIHKLVELPEDFGIHHSKMAMYVYKDDSIRVSISSANLICSDWECYNQGIWLSPLCPKLPDCSVDIDGESKTGFKRDLLDYLCSYKEMALEPYIKYVERADFSAVRVFLVYSIPGRHARTSPGSHLQKVADILSKYFVRSRGAWSIIAQASSIGKMGLQNATEWWRRALLGCLASNTKSRMPVSTTVGFSIVYPTVDNVNYGYFEKIAGGCLQYMEELHEEQAWLQKYMYQWKAEELRRTRVMPHIKSYCLVSPCKNKLGYYLLTSANISRSAWGTYHYTKDLSVNVRSYEAGVLFLPQFFGEDFFGIKDTSETKNQKLFPFMFDLPLTPYHPDDKPFCT